VDVLSLRAIERRGRAEIGAGRKTPGDLARWAALAGRLGWRRVEGLFWARLGYRFGFVDRENEKARDVLNRGAALLERSGDLDGAANTSILLTVVLGRLRRLDEAEATGRRAVELARAAENPNRVGRAYINLAEIRKNRGHPDDALRILERAHAVGRDAKDGFIVSIALANIGSIYRVRGETRRALACARASLEAAKAAGHRQGVVRALILMGAVLDDPAERLRVSREALRLDPDNPFALNNLAAGQGELERYRDAEATLARLLEKKLPPFNRVFALANLGGAHESRNRLPDARARYREALALATRLTPGERKEAALHLLPLLGTVLMKMGEHDQACARFREALDAARGSGLKTAKIADSYARSLQSHGAYEESRAQFEHALRLALEAKRHDLACRALLSLASNRVAAGRPREALPHAERALALARRHGDRRSEFVAMAAGLPRVHVRLGDPDQAVACVRASLAIPLDARDRVFVLHHILRWADGWRSLAPAIVRDLLPRAIELARLEGDRRREVRALAHLARVLEADGDLAAALAALEKARGVARRAKDEVAEAISLHHLGVLLAGPDPARSGAILKRSADLFLANGDPNSAADSLAVLGDLESNRGNLKEARLYLERALKLTQNTRSPNGIQLHRNLGMIYQRMGRLDAAVEHFKAAVQVPRPTSRALSLAAHCCAELGRLEEANAFAARALGLLSGSESMRLLLDVWIDLAMVDMAQGQFRRAETLLRRCAREAHKRKDRRREAFALLHLSGVHRMRGDIPGQIELLERIKDQPGPHRAEALVELGWVRHDLGEIDVARPLFDSAFAEAERTEQARVALRSINGIAACQKKRGDHAAAHATLRRGLVRCGEDRGFSSLMLGNLGSLSARMGRRDDALRYYKEAEALRPSIFCKIHIGLALTRLGRQKEARVVLERALAEARPRRDPRTADALTALAETLKWGDGVPLLEEAITIIEQRRVRARGLSTRQQLGHFRRLRRGSPYYYMVVAQTRLDRDAVALEYAERWRGRAVLDLLERSRVDPLADTERRARRRGDRKLIARIAQLRTDLHAADDEVLRCTQVDDGPALVRARTTRDRLLGERARIVRRLLPMGAPLRAKALQAMLGPKDRMLYYAVYEHLSMVFLVRPLGQGISSTAIAASHAKLSTAIGERRVAVARARGVAAPAATAKPDPGLFRTLVPPEFWKDVRGAEQLYIVADGPLHRLPFEMLVVDDKGTTWLDAGPPISYALSGSMLAWCKQRRDEQRDIELPHETLALGGAIFPKGLAPLPGTVREAKAVGSVTLLGKDATKEALFAAAPKARIIHLATHQIADERDGYGYSRMALTGGFLHLYELFEHWRDRLNACELVVLSACETAKGPLQRDEGPYAMPLGLLYAGTPAVIGSLWMVDDASTAELFVDFYQRLKNGTPKLEAFTEARKALKKKYPQPYHWAAFVYIGDPR